MVKIVTQKRKKSFSVNKGHLFNTNTAVTVTIPNIVSFYDEECLAPRPNPKLEYHPFSVVPDFFYMNFQEVGLGGMNWDWAGSG